MSHVEILYDNDNGTPTRERTGRDLAAAARDKPLLRRCEQAQFGAPAAGWVCLGAGRYGTGWHWSVAYYYWQQPSPRHSGAWP